MYFEDLERIIEIIKNVELSVFISDSDYEYDSIEEIEKYKGKKIKNLSIVGKKEDSWDQIDLIFGKEWISINEHGNNADITLSVIKIIAIIKNKFHWFQRIFEPWLWFTLSILTPGALFLLKNYLSRNTILIMLLIHFSVLIMIPISFYFKKIYPVIYLSRRFQVLNFWQRNRDKIITLIIGTFIGILFKLLYDFIF